MSSQYPHLKPIEGQPCAAECCQHLVQPGFLMCNEHWRMVPSKQRCEVRKWMRALGYIPTARQRYLQAVRTAVESVYQKQIARQERTEAASLPLF
ncbi:MAG: hypothetical protein K2W93_07125 [Burkholderiaceae bacterium]|nr:hypothetical protein [Burkholderiaceae bacterium]